MRFVLCLDHDRCGITRHYMLWCSWSKQKGTWPMRRKLQETEQPIIGGWGREGDDEKPRFWSWEYSKRQEIERNRGGRVCVSRRRSEEPHIKRGSHNLLWIDYPCDFQIMSLYLRNFSSIHKFRSYHINPSVY